MARLLLCIVSSLLPLIVLAAYNQTLSHSAGLTLNACYGPIAFPGLSEAPDLAAAAAYGDPHG